MTAKTPALLALPLVGLALALALGLVGAVGAIVVDRAPGGPGVPNCD